MLQEVAAVLLTVLLSSAFCQYNVTVSTSKGIIVGRRWDPNPYTKASYDSFLGIPYGRVNERFQPAVPAVGWSQPLVAHTDGPACPQHRRPYSEDCLYLNVFAPKNASKEFGRLAVMVFIHGGAFTNGNSSSRVYGPDWLVPQGVILVTLNYRLGALGFLTLGSKVAPGNQGLHDCVLALQWVREEISSFGGDPTQVTVVGASTGAVMAQILYLSHYSTGLVARAISQSGSVLGALNHVTPAEGRQRAHRLAQNLHCPLGANDSALLACLQAAPVEDIVNSQAIDLPIEEKVRARFLPFVPVLDSYKTAVEPFFNASLEDLMLEAIERDKRLLVGFNSEDGTVIFGSDVWNQTENHLLDLTPKRLSEAKRAAMVRKIASHYFPNVPDLNKVRGLVGLYTHIMFSYPVIKLANELGPVTFGYVFSHEGSWGVTPAYATRHRLTGAKHGDEIPYLFYRAGDPTPLEHCPSNRPNLAVRDMMVRWWTTFAKTGVPSSSWPTVAEGSYQIIDNKPSTAHGYNVESQFYHFWQLVHSTPNSAALTLVSLVELTVILTSSHLSSWILQ